MTDEQLLSRIAARDQAAFAEFYDRHAGRVLGLLRPVVRDDSLADDALQETFWQVWQTAARYDASRASALGWLAMLARSRGLDIARKRTTLSRVDDVDVALADTNEDVAERESAQVIKHAMAELPADQRSLIYLAFFCGLTQEQISRQTAMALGTVKTRIRRGIHRLREDLASHRRALA